MRYSITKYNMTRTECGEFDGELAIALSNTVKGMMSSGGNIDRYCDLLVELGTVRGIVDYNVKLPMTGNIVSIVSV
jgi:hypothetical protein